MAVSMAVQAAAYSQAARKNPGTPRFLREHFGPLRI